MWIPQCAQCFLHFWRYNNIPWKPVCHWDFDILMWLLPSWCDFLPTRCYMGLMWLLPNWCDLNPSLVTSMEHINLHVILQGVSRSSGSKTCQGFSWKARDVAHGSHGCQKAPVIAVPVIGAEQIMAQTAWKPPWLNLRSRKLFSYLQRSQNSCLKVV